jgi:alpha-tubulin suppressor-like RCC1 family protein
MHARRFVRSAIVWAAVLSTGGLTALACSDPDVRIGYVEPSDASTETTEASLPPTDDGGGRIDASDAAEPRDAGIPFDGAGEAVVCATTPCVTQLAGGDTYFCALLSDGTVRCWGTDVRGSLGRPDLDASADAAVLPAPVDGLEGVTQLSARQATCARLDGGAVRCWGSNSAGQLGIRTPPASDTLSHPIPTDVPLLEPALRVDANDNNTCAVLESGKVECWGLTAYGLLARITTGGVGGPDIATKIEPKVVKTSTGVALTEGAEVVTWAGVLGREVSIQPADPAFKPQTIPSLDNVHDLAGELAYVYSEAAAAWVPAGHTCAVAAGAVYCWGTTNTYGALCTGIPSPEPVPVNVSMPLEAGVFAQQITVSKRNTCVRLTDGSVRCCGVDDLGQLARGSIPDSGTTPVEPVFTPATAITGHVVQVALGGDTACALLQGGSVECWGSNAYGQLGNGTRDSAPHPVPVRVQF